MSAIKDIGKADIQTMYEEKQIQWQVPNLFSQGKIKDFTYYDSPTFTFAGNTWHFRLDGKTLSNYDIISLEIRKVSGSDEWQVEYKFGLKKVDGSVEQFHSISDSFTGEIPDINCERLFMKKSILLLQKDELAPNNVLTITCTLKRGTDCYHLPCTSQELNPL